MSCVRARPLWKVAEIAGTREIRLGIRKRMGNAFTPLLLVVILAIFVIVNQQTSSVFSYDYKLLSVESVGATKSAIRFWRIK